MSPAVFADEVGIPVIRILLVEDDFLVARVLVRLLVRHFVIVDVVDDVEAALRHIERDDVDLVITDFDLGPGRSTGLDLAAAIAARGADVPIILLSGSLDDRLVELAKTVGVRTTLKKPASPSVLVAAIRAAVGDA